MVCLQQVRARGPRACVTFIASLLAATTVAGTPVVAPAQTPERVFADPVRLPLGARVSRVRAADLDRDGRMDLVASMEGWIRVWTGAERVLLVPKPDATFAFSCGDFELADLDGDGLADFVGASELESLGACWARGRGDGTFEPPVTLLRERLSWQGIAVGRFDGDDKPDVALMTSSQELVLLRNEGDGNFGEHGRRHLLPGTRSLAGTPAESGPRSLLIAVGGGSDEVEADGQVSVWRLGEAGWTRLALYPTRVPNDDQQFGHLDGDGVLDWIGVFETGDAFTASGDADVGLKEATEVACRSGTWGHGAIGDLDRDELDDIVMPSRSDYWSLPRLEILYTRPDGSRDNAIRISMPREIGDIHTIRVADFDGDGLRDIAAFTGFWHDDPAGELIVIRNRGGRRFEAITHWPAPDNSLRVFAAQLDRGAAKEIVVLSASHFGVCDLDVARMPLPPRYLAPAPSTVAWGNETPIYFRDLNRDGCDDLLMRDGAHFTYALATGHGGLAEAVHEPWPGFAAAGDLDGRFGVDAVFLGPTGELSVAFRTAHGDFAPPLGSGEIVVPLPDHPTLLRCADLDRDGREELLVAHGWTAACEGFPGARDSVAVLRWNGAGFTALQRTPLFGCPGLDWSYPEWQELRDLAVLDIDGVGMLDIAVMTGGERGRVTPLTDGGEGFHTPSPNGWIPAEWPDELAEGDFDGDGWTDLASSHNYDGGIGHVTILQFDGSAASSRLPGAFVSENAVRTLAAGDFDGDGDDDLATLHWTGAWQDWWDESSALTVRWSLASENAAVTQLIDSGVRSARAATPYPLVKISAAWPNPARDAIHVRFATLPSGEARLELLDVSGRRVQERRLAATAGGEGVASFALGRDVAPGVYWLRLEQGGRASTTRIAVVR